MDMNLERNEIKETPLNELLNPEDNSSPDESFTKRWKYKTKYKQNAKGFWQGEFAVNADTTEELKVVEVKVNKIVQGRLSELNKDRQMQFSTETKKV